MSERRVHGDDLTGRRGGYTELKKEIHYFFRKIWVVVLLIGVTTAVGLVGYGFAIREIQDQRAQSCADQNERHDNAIKALREGSNADIQNSDKLGLSPDEIRRRRDVTIGLINAIAPVQDCSKVVETGLDAYLP